MIYDQNESSNHLLDIYYLHWPSHWYLIYYSVIIWKLRSGKATLGNRPLIQTIRLLLTDSCTSYITPGPLNLWLNHACLNSYSYWIGQSVPLSDTYAFYIGWQFLRDDQSNFSTLVKVSKLEVKFFLLLLDCREVRCSSKTISALSFLQQMQ